MITGCYGQVGSCLVEQLQCCSNIKTLALGRKELNIVNTQDVNDVVTKFKPDIIINAAAYTAVDRAEDEPEVAYDINYKGVENLAKSAHKINSILIHLSTDYVFDGTSEKPYNEFDEPSPKSIYGKSKLAGELAIKNNCPKHIILRTAWVFGKSGNNFVKTMLKLGSEQKSLNIVNDQFGGPTFSDDIAKTLILISNHLFNKGNVEYGVYHYSGSPYVSWYTFAECIFNKALDKGFISTSPQLNGVSSINYPTAAVRPNNSRLDCSRILKNFNIESSNWDLGLNDLLDIVNTNDK